MFDRQDFYEIQNSISQISLEFQSRRKPISIQREISSSTYSFHLLRNIQISSYPNIQLLLTLLSFEKYPNIQQLLKYPAATNSSIFWEISKFPIIQISSSYLLRVSYSYIFWEIGKLICFTFFRLYCAISIYNLNV